MRITTKRFGELEIDADKVITMPDGMVGFVEQRFTILNPENGGPFCWFQALDNPYLAFVIADPTQFIPGYRVKLTQEEHEKLQMDPGVEPFLLSVVTIAREPLKITLNLQGPIVINPISMIAKQIILEGNHTTRHELLSSREAARVSRIQKMQSPLTMSLMSSGYSGIGLAQAQACS